MWFQDLTGDGEPELIIGGYGLMIGQEEQKCFTVYEKIMELLQREKISIPYGVVTEVIMDMMRLPLLHIKIQTENNIGRRTILCIHRYRSS